MKNVIIYSDGACDGNPGPGGWAAVLVYGRHVKEISGGDPATTNNRMEIQAAVEALRALKESCAAEFCTDSEYLRRGITDWIKTWKARAWRTRGKTQVKNADLWRALDEAASRHQVTWHWVKAHAGHAKNERCDALARSEIGKLRRKHPPAQLAMLLKDFLARNYGNERKNQTFLSLNGAPVNWTRLTYEPEGRISPSFSVAPPSVATGSRRQVSG
ncbi:MAG: ribonuclease HI [Verrucomicrobia bacterium]|nr:ribonuclease HI [Verrucomicrobiota bacterium]